MVWTVVLWILTVVAHHGKEALHMSSRTKRLSHILESMDVPPERLEDYEWLNRNLFFRNSDHPDYQEAKVLIAQEVVRSRKEKLIC